MEVDDTYYYAMLSGLAGVELKGEYQLISMIRELAEKKKAYEKVEAAIQSVESTGYGVILPEQSEITLDEPTGDPSGKQIRRENPGHESLDSSYPGRYRDGDRSHRGKRGPGGRSHRLYSGKFQK